jgi:hypothetical protein
MSVGLVRTKYQPLTCLTLRRRVQLWGQNDPLLCTTKCKKKLFHPKCVGPKRLTGFGSITTTGSWTSRCRVASFSSFETICVLCSCNQRTSSCAALCLCRLCLRSAVTRIPLWERWEHPEGHMRPLNALWQRCEHQDWHRHPTMVHCYGW